MLGYFLLPLMLSFAGAFLPQYIFFLSFLVVVYDRPVWVPRPPFSRGFDGSGPAFPGCQAILGLASIGRGKIIRRGWVGGRYYNRVEVGGF